MNFDGSPGMHMHANNSTEIPNEIPNINETQINTTINETMNSIINNTINATTNMTINETQVNETIEFNTTENSSVNISKNISGCLIELKIELRNYTNQTIPIIQNNEQIKFKNKIIISEDNEINSSVEYWVEDLLGNIVKNKVVTNNEDYKSYTPKIKTKDEVLIIKNKIVSISSSECNITNSHSEKIIIIKNTQFGENEDEKSKENEKECLDPKKKTNSTTECNCDTLLASIQKDPPQLKILNVCNTTIKNYGSSIIEEKATQQAANKSSDASIDYMSADPQNQQIQPNTKNSSSKISAMISYESENIKNKIYAIIGLVIISIIVVLILLRKHFRK